jgi:protein-tyrosine phosphatase
MKSVFWLVRDSIAGRPGPQMEPWSLPELREAGFQAVLNLSEHAPDFEAMRSAGIEASWVALPTDVPPTGETAEKCLQVLPQAWNFLSAQLASGRRVLVHCYAGKDRTGLLLALYVARRHGLSPAAAIAKVRETRALALTAPGWEGLALEVIPRMLATLP